ncbi:mandelate racemase/muconate lactonizing enzyme family protein [Herbiconiux sp. A18JL235]|uniref:Mandelate racemase/muconate lactonizing enzyme family protein n=1 Tax=Herbiconiux sp. A18JL235 TaxID=3152363 RepID=A0AB39BHZ0_9MICO
MKIREIRIAGLRGATPRGGWTMELRPDSSLHTLVSVHTDDGRVGLGSVFTHEALVRGAIEVLSELIVGREFTSPPAMTEELHQHTFWMGRGGSITHAISGINIALWDLAGQAWNAPVSRLIGGDYRDRVRPYASLLMDEPGLMRDNLLALSAQGFTAFKIGWGRFGRDDSGTDELLVRTAREAIGPGALLAVDAGGSDGYWHNGVRWALDTARMLADHDVAWFEEALNPDDIDGFVRLSDASPVPISGGETLTRRQTFSPYVDRGAFDIVQPDVTKVGGIDELMAVGRRSEDAGVKLVPHGWNTAVGLAADLHIAAALRFTDLVEYCTGSAYIDDLTVGGWTLDSDGQLAVPSAAGLGVEWDADALEQYTGGVDLLTP